jgi:hypothetical protein
MQVFMHYLPMSALVTFIKNTPVNSIFLFPNTPSPTAWMGTSSKQLWGSWNILYKCEKYLHHLWKNRHAKRHWWVSITNSRLFWTGFIRWSHFLICRGGVRIAINVCISTVMASPCSINVWITANSNGPKMKSKYAIFHNRNFVGSLKGYRFSSKRRFKHHQKVCFKFVKPLILSLFQCMN